jgi:glycosyltransferase involved in cell wall biosynthesis
MERKDDHSEISIILPCRNEEESLDFCLNQIEKTIKKNNLSAEIIVSDSSVDKSPQIAQKHGVTLVKHDKEGYGIAYLEALKIARGKYIFMADCDGTYDFKEIPNFIYYLRNGYDLAIGNRFAFKMEKGAMPYLHKLGNPILSGTLRMFFGVKIRDSHCGMRAIKKKSLLNLNLQTAGMEFASEMIVKSARNKLKMREIPIHYYKRMGESKLKPFSDAWKHMRFMLLYSPLFLFFIPGTVLFLTGFLLMIWPGPLTKNLFLPALTIITGYQLIVFSVFAKTYSIVHLKEQSPAMDKLYKYITIERASIIGITVAILGVIIYSLTFSPIASLTLITIGVQTIFSSFMLSILGIKEK